MGVAPPMYQLHTHTHTHTHTHLCECVHMSGSLTMILCITARKVESSIFGLVVSWGEWYVTDRAFKD